jgi:UDP-N-acetylmuramyl pentapeptide synthase
MARDTPARVVTYGTAAGADVRCAGDVRDTPDGLTFTLEANDARQPVTLAFSGRHNVSNALAASAAGVALGFDVAGIAHGLASARPVAGRCVWKRAGAVRILDDTYNASPPSVQAALDTVHAHRGGGRAIVVLGDMLELGEITDEAHRDVGRRVARLQPALFVATGRASALAVEAAREAGLTDARHVDTVEDAVAAVADAVTPGDVVLVKGSRGMRMERVVDALVTHLAPEPGRVDA